MPALPRRETRVADPVRDLPQSLDRTVHIDLAGTTHGVWARRLVLLCFLALVAAALANLFGQRVSTTATSRPAADFAVEAPAAARGGLIYQTTFTITAHRPLRKP